MTQENYPACVAFVRRQEGGNTDTSGDPGGRTGRGGVTQVTYNSFRTAKGLSIQDVWNISDAEIADIYANLYWAPIHGDNLEKGVDLCTFDYAINSGPTKANLERLQAIAQGGTNTVAVIRKICGDRLSFLHALRTWKRFGKDWGRRVSECEVLALQMAGSLVPAIAQEATARRADHARGADRTIVGGVTAAAGVHQWMHGSLWVVAGVIFMFVLLAGVLAFNAWRQGQRSDALTAAVYKMQLQHAAAAEAKTIAISQANLKAESIASEQTALEAAKAVIANN